MPKIEIIYAFIVIDREPDDEGIVGIRIGTAWMPLVGADEKRMESLRPIAQKIAKETGKKIIVAKFKFREDVEVIT